MTESDAAALTQEAVVHLEWDGPYSLEQALAHTDRSIDYGIYHVCGPHPVYGAHTLLYVGKAAQQSFGVRLSQERWDGWQKANGTISIYLGRLSGAATPKNDEWNRLIARTERLLICSHRPSHNAKGIYRGNADDHYLHVLNWGNRGALLPEVSGSRWMGRFAKIPDYGPYGSHSNINVSLPAETNATV